MCATERKEARGKCVSSADLGIIRASRCVHITVFRMHINRREGEKKLPQTTMSKGPKYEVKDEDREGLETPQAVAEKGYRYTCRDLALNYLRN